ncbi:MAG: PQQ-binding-like beta-propeller repeat protein [bacterium]
MMKMRVLAVMVAGLACADGFEGKPEAEVLATGSGRVLLLSPQGEVVWEHPAGNVHDVWRLPNGNVLFADGNITEVTRDHKVVFEYKPENQKGGGAYTCQRLTNGNTVVGENASGRVVEVDKTGKVVFTLMTRYTSTDDHHHMRMARKLANGNYLVCHSGSNLVREYKPDGTTAWETPTKALAFAAVRLANGNTLVSSLNQITEYDKNGKETWEFKKTDLPGVVIQNITGFHVLPNGNLVAGCYSAYNGQGEGTGLFEITRDKKLAWRYVSPGRRDGTMMGVHKLAKGAEQPLR